MCARRADGDVEDGGGEPTHADYAPQGWFGVGWSRGGHVTKGTVNA
jgi:hypothetical protein